MKEILWFIIVFFLLKATLNAQAEPAAGKWKTWFISSGKVHRLPALPDGQRSSEGRPSVY